LRKIGYPPGERGLKLPSQKEKIEHLELLSELYNILAIQQRADDKVREIVRRLPSRAGAPFWGDDLSSFSMLDHEVRKAAGKTPWDMKLTNSMREEAEKIRKQINPCESASDNE
jgi:hypothetical protein